MSTLNQKKAVKVVVSGGTPTEGMRVAKYAPSVIRKPKVLTESKGWKEEMARYGLTEKLISSSLVADIKAKPQNRKPELELGAKILRMTGDDKEGGDQPKELHLHLHKNERVVQIVSSAEDRLREELEGEITSPSKKENEISIPKTETSDTGAGGKADQKAS